MKNILKILLKFVKNYMVLPILSINFNGKSYFFMKLRHFNEYLRNIY